MTETLLVQNLAYILAVCLEGEWFLFLIPFLPKKPSLKKILTPFLGENVAYETLVNYTKPWALYLVLVLRNRGSNIKKSKIAFFQNFFLKKTLKPIFFEIFFDENGAQEPAQLLAETWCPYMLWVLRNLPHTFEKLAHVTKTAKKTSPYGHLAKLEPQKLNANNKARRFARRLKNVTIWAPRKARAPKTKRKQ